MGTTAQLKLLLWKDGLVRKRHIGVAALVFGWAVAVFLILYIVRESVDPEYSPTCQYKARALPSTGLFPFIQSFICNVDNKCNDLNQYEEVPQYSNARLTGVAKQLETAFNNETILNVVKSLPDMIDLLKAVGSSLDSPELEGIFGPGIEIRTLFDDSQEMKKKLKNIDINLDPEIIDDVFDASLKFGHIFKSFGSTDMGSAICDPKQLEKYLILDEPNKINNVSAALCNISGKHVPVLLQNVIENVDFGGLLAMVSKVVDQFTQYSMFDDIRSMAKVILNLNLAKDYIPSYLKLNKWLPDIIPLMKNMNKTHIDSEYVKESLKIIEPNFEDTEVWPAYKNLVLQTTDFLENLQNNLIDSGVVQNNTKIPMPKNFSEFVSHLQSNVLIIKNISDNPLNISHKHVLDFANNTLYMFQNFYLHSSKPWLTIASMLDSLVIILGESTLSRFSTVTFFYNEIILSLHNIIRNEFEFEKIVYDLSQKHSNTISTLLSLGPDFIINMLNCFADFKCTEVIVQYRHNISELFCDKEKTELILPKASSIKNIEMLCNVNFDDFINDSIEKFNFDIIIKSLNNTKSNEEDLDTIKGNFTLAVENTENLVRYIMKKNNRSEDTSLISWEQILPDIETDEWKNIVSTSKRNKGLYIMNVQLSYLKYVSEHYTDINKILKASEILMRGVLTEIELLPIPAIPNFFKYVTNDITDIVDIFTNKTQILASTSIDSWLEEICHVSDWPKMHYPYTMQTLLCDIISYINLHNSVPWFIQPLTSSIYKILNNYDKTENINWDNFVSNAQNIYFGVSDFLEYGIPKYDWKNLAILQTKFWLNWFKNFDLESGMRFGLQVTTKIADIIDKQLFNLENQNHLEEISLTNVSSAQHISVLILQMCQMVANAELYPQVKDNDLRIYLDARNILFSLDEGGKRMYQMTDENYEFYKDYDVTELSDWLLNPCVKNTTILAKKYDFIGGQKIFLDIVQKFVCNYTQLENKYQDTYLTNSSTMNESIKVGYYEDKLQRTILLFEKFLHEIRQYDIDSPAGRDDLAKFNEQLNFFHLGMKFQESVYKIFDKRFQKLTAEDKTLSEFWSELNDCQKDKSQKNCTKIQTSIARHTSKFITTGLNELINRMRTYINVIKGQNGVDPLTLIGFSNTSGIYQTYLKFPDFIQVLVHTYRSNEFERKIFEAKTTGDKLRCADIMNSLIIPDHNSVTKDDITILRRYVCPSIFDWPILQDNFFLSTVSALQDLYLDTPVSKLNITFVGLTNNIFNLKMDVADMIKHGEINVTVLWNKEWISRLNQTFYDLKKLNFTSENSVTRYFKYFDEVSFGKNISLDFINPDYGFGEFSVLLKNLEDSLNNFVASNFTTSQSIAEEEIKDLKDYVNNYSKDILNIFAYVYVKYKPEARYFWMDFDRFCNTTDRMNEIEIFIPSWLEDGDKEILEKICSVKNETIRNSMISASELAEIKNFDVNLEDIVMQFISTLINFINNNKTITLSSNIVNNFDIYKLINGSLPSDEELRNASLQKAHLFETHNNKYKINHLDAELDITTVFLKVLKGGDWWQNLKDALQFNIPVSLMLNIAETLPHIVTHLADAALSPHLLRDITQTIIEKGPISICSHTSDLGRLVKDKNLFSIFHKLCTCQSNCSPDNVAKMYIEHDENGITYVMYKLNETLLAEHIYEFEKSLVDLIRQGPKKFELPKWLNETEILQEYEDFAIENNKPLKLLQTVTTVLNEAIDIGALFYMKDAKNCTWCNWATTFVKEASYHLSKSRDYTEFLCQAPKMNFTEIRNTLLTDFRWGEFYKDMTENKTYTVQEFDNEIHDIVDVIRVQLIAFYTNKTLRALPEKCLKRIGDMPALKNISTYVTGISEIAKVLKSSSTYFFNSTSSLFNISSNNFSHLIVTHIPISKSMQTVLKYNNSLINDLKNKNISNFASNEIWDSKVDVNLMIKINDSVELEKYLQTLDSFNKLFSFQNLTSAPIVFNEIKYRDIPEVAAVIFENINKTIVDNKINVWRNDSLKNLEWIANIFQSLEKVIANGGDLLKFVSNIDFSVISSGSFNISGMLKGILELLEHKSIEKLFQSLRELIKNVSPLINNTKYEDDLYNIVTGVEDLKIFKSLGLLPLRYNISDLFSNWSNIKKYLVQEVHLDSAIADDILSAQVDLTAILSSQEDASNFRDIFCKPKELTKILYFHQDNSDVVSTRVSSALCNLTMTDIQNIAVVTFKNFNFSKTISTIMNTSVSNILSAANKTEEEGKILVKNIGIGAELMPFMKSIIANVSGNMNILPSFDKLKSSDNGNQSLVISPDLLASASTMLCGRALVQSSNKLYKVISQAKDFNAEKYDAIEESTLPTQFCRNVYKDVINMEVGKVIWAYIKPLLRGKILFTPNTPEVRKILTAANSTFHSIAELEEVLFKITEGLTSLEDKEKIEHMLDNIQEFLNSSVVQIAVESVISSVTNRTDFSLKDLNITGMLNNFGDPTKISRSLKFGADMLRCVLMDRFIGVESETKLEEQAKELMHTNEFIAGIVFTNLERRNKRSLINLPQDITYKIRMDIDSVPSTSYLKYKFWTPGPESDFLDELRYFRGFIQLQDLIDSAIIQMKSSEPLPVWDTLTQELPYSCFTRDFFKSALSISQTFQVCFFFGLIAFVAAAVRYVVWEKESGNTMVMNVMGLKYLTHCVSWFIVTVTEVLIIMIVIFIILKAGGIIPMSNSFILILYLFEFGFTVVMFCYMISSIFNSASLAAVGSAIFYLLSFMPYIIIISLETILPFWAKMLTNLSMSTTFCYGCLYIIRYEVQGVGLQWSNAWETPIPGDSMNFGLTCIFLIIDGILYGLIGYMCSRKIQDLQKVFMYLPSHWFTNFTHTYRIEFEPPSYVTFDNDLFFDTNGTGENYLDDTVSSTNIVNDEPLKIGVTIKGLTKIYNSRKKTVKAINDIDITLYTGQVTTLLGHNGAGKTTLIKILTGMMQPTSGQIIINSEITENGKETNRFLGVCPQASVLINTMTAAEHLIFYARLKTSKSTMEVISDVMDMIDSLNLGRLSNEPVAHLSEGMRRRLCVAIAFIGKPKLVVLDEPSSGVDPVARRQIWDLVIRYKEGCTVLLTTHYLDEAELLSDRVVVLHKGKVLCCGSPLILKQSYGNGYKITVSYPIEKEKYEVNENNVNALVAIISSVASNAALGDVRGFDVNVIVPFNSSEGVPNNFEKVALALEENQPTLGFSYLAMNCATLEQVFLDLCNYADIKEDNQLSKTDSISQLGKSYSTVFSNSVENFSTIRDDEVLVDTGEKLTGSYMKKFCALLKKRAIHCMYDWRVLFCALILPTLFTAVAMGFSLIRPPNSNEPALKLTPELYESHTTSFISVETNDMTSFVNKVSREIVGLTPYKDLGLYQKTYRDCVCTDGHQECLQSSNPIYDTLLKMSSANETVDWLVDTQNEYIERRYGGWSLSDQAILNRSSMIVWFNNKGYHSMPSYLNTMNSAILRTVSPGSTITTYNHPLKLSVDQLSKSSIAQHIADVGIAMVLLIAFSLVPASGSIYLVQERVNEEKRLQFLCGVSPTLYWLVAFIWDLLVLLCALVLAVIVFKIFGLPVYVARDNMAAVSLLIFLYGWACIPFVHLVQRLFNDPSMANMILFCVCAFIGIAELTCLLLMDILGKTQFVADFRDVLHKIYLLFPQFVLGDGLVEISKNNIQSEILERFHMDTYVSPLSWDLMGLHYLSLALVGFILFLLNIIIENEWFKYGKKSPVTYPSDTTCLEAVNLTKEYKTSSGKILAVDDITLKVPFGQCLGLIGVNGAGKSTTFKMLTTELRPTSGRIFLQSREIAKKPLYTGEMGYCAQCDSLDAKLTVKQTLQLYLTLRGTDNKNEIINKMLTKFELNNYANRRTENLSGGNRRKLCTALSVLGKTSLILMDEPTSGMDPYSRALVGVTIQQLIKQNRSVILTSHSVEDCEALCSNVAVMINGKIICHGSPQDLKERYGSGYIISVRLTKSTEQDKLLELMQKHFPGTQLMSRQYCSSQFAVPTEQTKLSEMFSRMTKISEYVSVEDYNLIQSSLDQVFINLANKSNELNSVTSEDNKICMPNMYSMDVL